MGDKTNLLNIGLAVVVFVLGFIYLERPKYKKRIFYIDWDKKVFPNLKDENISVKADKLMFIICEAMGLLILVNGLLAYFFNIENISMIFLIIVFLTWPIRLGYIYFRLAKK